MQRFSRAKFFAAFLGMIGAALFLFLAWRWYDLNYGPDPIMRAVKQAEEEDYRAAMADTYGGKTPQETLQLYIAAVEKGDYELASKYFIGDNQKKELEKLQKNNPENLAYFASVLKHAQLEDKRAFLERMYQNDLEQFRITEAKEDYIRRIGAIYEGRETMKVNFDGNRFSISFKSYPNGIWKIIEI